MKVGAVVCGVRIGASNFDKDKKLILLPDELKMHKAGRRW